MRNRRGAVCPECGGTITGTVSGGVDTEGHRIRLRLCRTCDTSFTTVEVAIPFSFIAVDVAKRDRLRSQRGTFVSRVTPDYLEVESAYRGAESTVLLRIKKGSRSNRCRRGLHELVGRDVYVNPKTGQRVCQPCRRESATARYHHAMKHMPPAIRAEHNARNRVYLAQRRAERKVREGAAA